MVAILAKETSVVMVVHKDAQSVNILEVLCVLSPSIGDGSHGLSVNEDVLYGEVHGIVEQCCDVVLVVAYVSIEPVEDFTHLENARSLTILTPEIFRNFRNGINANTVEVVGSDELMDPVLKVLADV
jgi:hypothetical protein